MLSLPRTLNKALLCFLLVNLCACSFFVGEDGIFRDRKKDYRKSESVPRIEVPENLDDQAIIDLYPVPAASPYSDGDMVNDFPLPVGVTNTGAAVKIQAMGDIQWVLLQSSGSQVWPRLKEFLSLQGLALTVENGAIGMVEARAEDGIYRYRIEQGFQRNTSELSVRFLSPAAAAAAFWPEQSTDIAKEQAMISAVAQFFADASDQSAYSFAAQGISTQKKITVEYDGNGGKALALAVNEQRAWLTLQQSLVKADFTIQQTDEQDRSYIAQYTPPLSPDDQPGMIARFFRIKPDPYDKDVKYAGEHYQFRLTGDGDLTRLVVKALDTEGQGPDDIHKEQNFILLLLKERLY